MERAHTTCEVKMQRDSSLSFFCEPCAFFLFAPYKSVPSSVHSSSSRFSRSTVRPLLTYPPCLSADAHSPRFAIAASCPWALPHHHSLFLLSLALPPFLPIFLHVHLLSFQVLI